MMPVASAMSGQLFILRRINNDPTTGANKPEKRVLLKETGLGSIFVAAGRKFTGKRYTPHPSTKILPTSQDLDKKFQFIYIIK